MLTNFRIGRLQALEQAGVISSLEFREGLVAPASMDKCCLIQVQPCGASIDEQMLLAWSSGRMVPARIDAAGGKFQPSGACVDGQVLLALSSGLRMPALMEAS